MQRVLEVAARAFAERGFHAVSMDEVAAAAGVSKPVVYTHFESKDGLYEAAVLDATEQFTARIRSAALPEQDAEERLWAGIQAFLDAVEEHPEWWRLTRQAALAADDVVAGLADHARETTSDTIAMLLADTAALTGTAGADATFEPLSRAFVGACAAVAEWWIAHPEVPKGTIALGLMNMLWMGFGDLAEANLWLPPEARET